MAKAIYGHTGVDARLMGEVSRLRARVRELELELQSLREVAPAADGPEGAWDPGELLLVDDALVPHPG